jgi:hypothetical protein
MARQKLTNLQLRIRENRAHTRISCFEREGSPAPLKLDNWTPYCHLIPASTKVLSGLLLTFLFRYLNEQVVFVMDIDAAAVFLLDMIVMIVDIKQRMGHKASKEFANLIPRVGQHALNAACEQFGTTVLL